jgi:hypothetical protein
MRSRFLIAALLGVAGLANVGGASAAPASATFNVVGYEYAFTSTIGCFAGTTSGNAGDSGTWNACVQHDRLGTVPTYIDGGSVALATSGPGDPLDAVIGSFVYHGGTITTIDSGAGCSNQQYLVKGSLQDVATTTSGGGSGTFSAILTHYRISIFGACIIYKAKVVGAVSLVY